MIDVKTAKHRMGIPCRDAVDAYQYEEYYDPEPEPDPPPLQDMADLIDEAVIQEEEQP